MFEQELLNDDEIQRLILENIVAKDSVTEDEIALAIQQMNGAIMTAELVDMWRQGWVTAIVNDGQVHYKLTQLGCETFDRWRAESRDAAAWEQDQ